MSAASSPPYAPPAGRARVALVVLVVYAVFWIQFSVVRVHNFGGVDEWMILSLVKRGAVDVPYANRPLGLLFNLPAGLFPGHLLSATFLLHAHYLVLAGCATALLLLALAPQRPDWALLGGVLAATWAPADLLRLDGVYSSAYSGVTAASVLVFLLLVEGARRSVLVAVAAGVAFLATRVHEGALPVLLGAPLLLAALGVRLQRGALAFYLGVMAVAALVAGLPLLRGRPESWYQARVMGVYLDPLGLASRLAAQFWSHVGPLVTTPPRELLQPRGVLAATLLAPALAYLSLNSVEPRPRRRLAVALASSLAAAALAYSGFIVAGRMAGANRAQFLAAPWIGSALAALVLLVSSATSSRKRALVCACLGAFVAAAGAARVARLQGGFDRLSTYERDTAALEQVVAAAPHLAPDTLIVLVDHSQAWLGSYVFHHALDLVYGGHVAGCVPNAREALFYDCFQGPDGVRLEPWPIVARAWGARPRTYGYDELVVFRADGAGRIELLTEWPAELPALPAGATYAPRARFDAPRQPPPQRSVLDGR